MPTSLARNALPPGPRAGRTVGNRGQLWHGADLLGRALCSDRLLLNDRDRIRHVDVPTPHPAGLPRAVAERGTGPLPRRDDRPLPPRVGGHQH
jgi:hypothetical protein